MLIHDNLDFMTIILRFRIVGSLWEFMEELGFAHGLSYYALVIDFVELWGFLLVFLKGIRSYICVC